MSVVAKTLALETGLSESDVRRIMSSAPSRYKVYSILKRNGKPREISQPAREVKLVQRAFSAHFLSSLPVHECATAYRMGLSIRENAAPHAGDGPILKMDFSNFFPSIRGMDWVSYCYANGVFDDPEDIRLSTTLLFRRAKGSTVLRLAIGAPTSPILSNILLFEFDRLVEHAVSRNKVAYTRYADDLTFSAPRMGFLKGVQKDVASIVRKIEFPKLDINHEKTTYVTRKYGRTVTGLTLSNDGRITVGKNRKHGIRVGVYKFKRGELSKEESQKLCGELAFVNAVEPEFIENLKGIYGDGIVVEIQKYVIV